MKGNDVVVLLVEDNRDFANLASIYLKKYYNPKDSNQARFDIIWKENGELGLKEIERNPDIDVVLMDYFLPGMNGLQVTRSLRQKRPTVPIIFVTVNKDFDLAVEVMKLGVDDYLVKEEISTPVLPMTILNVLEKQRLRDQLTSLEVSQQRLEAMRKMIAEVVKSITEPMEEMEEQIEKLGGTASSKNYENFLKIMRENVARLAQKLEQLKLLDKDKTVQYIRDIRMIDLS